LYSNFVKFVRLEIGEIVRYLLDKTKKTTKFRLPLKLSLLRESRPKSGQLPTMFSECSRFRPNRLTFGGVIADRLKTAKYPGCVNPIFGESLASSRIIKRYTGKKAVVSDADCEKHHRMRLIFSLQADA